VHGVLAQRLVRRVCGDCAEPYTPDEHEMAWLRAQLGDAVVGQMAMKRGAGCSYCNLTGYRGRIAVYELLEVDRELADAIRRNELTQFAELAASRRDYKPLVQSALELVGRGLTTVAEAMGSMSGVGDEPLEHPDQAEPEADLGPERVLSLLS